MRTAELAAQTNQEWNLEASESRVVAAARPDDIADIARDLHQADLLLREVQRLRAVARWRGLGVTAAKRELFGSWHAIKTPIPATTERTGATPLPRDRSFALSVIPLAG